MFVENKLRKGHVLVPFYCVLASQGVFRYPRKKGNDAQNRSTCPLANFFDPTDSSYARDIHRTYANQRSLRRPSVRDRYRIRVKIEMVRAPSPPKPVAAPVGVQSPGMGYPEDWGGGGGGGGGRERGGAVSGK